VERNSPSVSIIIPLRNEERYIERLLHALAAQTYRGHIAEILFVDGMSTDRTREIILAHAHELPPFRILDNPKRIVPCAMNIGIREARGDVIVRIDAHTEPAPDYVERCVYWLCETGAWNVGGPMRARGEGYVGQAVALATTSPFGIGGSPFHYSERPQYVDTVYLGAYPRSVLVQVGPYDERFAVNEDYELNYRLRRLPAVYDERFVANQDYELNYRVRRTGGRIFLAPDIRITYFPRESLKALWRQYFRYGFWKVQTIRKHPRSAKWRHLVAPAFVAGLLGSFLLGFVWHMFWRLLAGVVALYLLLAVVFSALRARKERGGLKYLPLMPVVFATLHLAWGLGFWWAWLCLLLGRDPLRTA